LSHPGLVSLNLKNKRELIIILYSLLVIGTSRTVGSAKKFVWIASGVGGGEFTKSSTTKAGRHYIAEILLKVALSAINKIIKSSEVERSTNHYNKPAVVLSRGFVLYVIYSLVVPQYNMTFIMMA
jgi:hypothetical protein